MSTAQFATDPAFASYDVIIAGGAIMGSSAAWFLSRNPDFDGRILVIERDPSYAACSTAHTNSCIRQQFSTTLNVQISQFTAAFIKNLREEMGGDPRVPNIEIQNYGYMYLADTAQKVAALTEAHAVQIAAGAGTRLMTPEDIAAEYPFYDLSGILMAHITPRTRGIGTGARCLNGSAGARAPMGSNTWPERSRGWGSTRPEPQCKASRWPAVRPSPAGI